MASSPNPLQSSTAPVAGSITELNILSTPPPSRRPAIDSLTSLRGLAALWVVLYHFQADIVTLAPRARFLLPFVVQGHFAVPIFFVLSGFVLTYNYLDSMSVPLNRSELFRFWGRRLLRIYPLHLATLIAVLLMVIAARFMGLTITETGYGWRDFIFNLLLIHTWVPHFHLNWNYPSWSVSSEWFAYLFFPLACLVFVRIRRLASLVGLALFFYAISIGLMLAGSRLPFSEMTAVVGPFLLGCTFARAIGLGYVPGFGLRIGAWVLLFTLVLLPYITAGQALAIAMTTTGAALVFALGASGEGCSRFWLWKPLIVLGEVSYSLYLVHTIAQKLLYEIAPSTKFAARSLPVRLIVLGGYVTSVALVTWLAYVWVDGYFRGSLRRRFSRRPNTSPMIISGTAL
jgi:peptidoglycan/LPS O-acetylase OafA/YrhL